MKKLSIFGIIVVATANLYFSPSVRAVEPPARAWTKYEIPFSSDKTYENPLYDVKHFKATFTSPGGRSKTVHGFWDGGRDWKIRLQPDEQVHWTYRTACSDTANAGLHGLEGALHVEDRLDLVLSKIQSQNYLREEVVWTGNLTVSLSGREGLPAHEDLGHRRVEPVEAQVGARREGDGVELNAQPVYDIHHVLANEPVHP